MFGEYGNGFNQYPPMQQQSQYPFIQQKPTQFTPQPQQPVINTFALQNSNPVQTIVTREMFDNLNERITALEGMNSNGQPTTISSANEPKSKPSSIADVRK